MLWNIVSPFFFWSCFFISMNSFGFLNATFSAEIQKKDSVVTDKNIKADSIEKIMIIPRIKMIEKNSLKSYSWWEKEDPKTPNLYKQVLAKIKEDFLFEKIEIEYVFRKINKENMAEFENQFLIFGSLILDSINKTEHVLKDLSLYKVEKGQLKLLTISNYETQNVNSSFKSLAIAFKEKSGTGLSTVVEKVVSQPFENEVLHLVVFESELSFEELNQIRTAIKDSLNIDLEKIKLLYSETKKYTFQISSKNNPFESLKKVTFVNGPYESEMLENALVFKPYTEEDFL